MPSECFRTLVLAPRTGGITALGYRDGITLTADDRPDDCHARAPGPIGEHVWQLQDHQRQRFLHVEAMGCAMLEHVSALAAAGTEASDLGVGTNGATQQAACVHLWHPLGIIPVRCAPGHRRDVAGIADLHRALTCFEDRTHGKRGNTGCRTRDMIYATLHQPVSEVVPIRREGTNRTHRIIVVVGWHSGAHDMRAAVPASGMGMDDGQLLDPCACSSTS